MTENHGNAIIVLLSIIATWCLIQFIVVVIGKPVGLTEHTHTFKDGNTVVCLQTIGPDPGLSCAWNGLTVEGGSK